MTTDTRKEEFRDLVRRRRREGVERLDVDRDVEFASGQATGPTSRTNEAVLAYLRDNAERFASPREDRTCIGCNTTHVFEWGIVHGRGHCVRCGWPARLYHYVEVEGRERDVRWVGMLQYHPDQIVLPEDPEPETGDDQ